MESLDKKVEEFIIAECCAHYKVDLVELKNSTRISTKALVARNMCVVLMKKHIPDYTDIKIANTLNKEASTIVKTAMKEFYNMDAKIKHEKIFLDIYHALNDKVKTFKVQVKVFNN